jgi:hypothetical protein
VAYNVRYRRQPYLVLVWALDTVCGYAAMVRASNHEARAAGKDKVIENDHQGSLGSSSIIGKSHLSDYKTLDPTSRVVDIINDVYFRAAAMYGILGPAAWINLNLSPDEEHLSQREIDGIRTDPNGTVYFIKMRWYIIAASIQSFAILFAALLYWGWWQLGRHVSFSPIEIAKAFDAPLLQNVNTNSRAKDLLRDVGNLRIRYGASTPDTATSGRKETRHHPIYPGRAARSSCVWPC